MAAYQRWPLRTAAAVFVVWASYAPSYAAVDPKADTLLRSMSELLASAQAFRFTTVEHHERLRRNGERVTREFSRTATVRRPDRVRFDFKGDDRDGSVYYDGSKLSFVGHKMKLWARTGVPPTIDQAMDYIAVRLGVPVPMADILYSSPYEALVGEDTTGTYEGTEEIGDKTCHRLSFEHEVVDYDVWVDTGERALPCQIEMHYKLDAGTPMSRITFTGFELSPQMDDAQFAFTPPADYRRIRVVGRREPAAAPAASSEEGAAPDEATEVAP
jgi:hypothetical protein